MIITFIGHSDFIADEKICELIKKKILENVKNEKKIEFFCGGYGKFDFECAKIAREIKKERDNVSVNFVTPYLSESFLEKIKMQGLYDEIICPDLGKTPYRVRIIKRNEYMISLADLVIAYVERNRGGAYLSLRFAQRIKKRIINIT